ncbi:MAG: substrate-binding domain-containing protein [Candidatus Kariarchaeaceae archaeon]
MEYRDEWIVNGDFDKEKAYLEAEKLLKHRERPTAIFCSDDYMAIGVMERIKEYGLELLQLLSDFGHKKISEM